MWRRPLKLLRSIALSRQAHSYPPQFSTSTFCDSCRLKFHRRARQFHTSSATLRKRSNDDDDEDDDDEDDDEDDDDDVDDDVQAVSVR